MEASSMTNEEVSFLINLNDRSVAQCPYVGADPYHGRIVYMHSEFSPVGIEEFVPSMSSTLINGIKNINWKFGTGTGVDKVFNNFSLNKLATISITPDLLPEDIVVSRKGNELLLSTKNTMDTLSVFNYFSNDGPSLSKFEQIKFANGTTWSVTQVENMLLIGTDAAQEILGYDRADTIHAAGGDDWVFGNGGNDTLFGGSGADYLFGGDGNDTLYGEDGKDSLFGDAGNDKLFGGNDADYLYGADGNDRLYGENGNDFLNGGTGNDRLFGGNDLDLLSGGAGNDTLYGEDGDDALYGGADNDKLFGGNGNDVLDGGSGSDQLNGGSGFDTYLFGRGYGNDKIFNDNDDDGMVHIQKYPDSQINGVLRFKSDVLSSDVTISRKGDNLTLNIEGGSDSVTVEHYFGKNGAIPRGLEIVFSNDTLDYQEINKLLTGVNVAELA